MKKTKIFYLGVIMILGLFTINSCKKENDCTEQTWYQDADGDGFGNINQTLEACAQPTGYVLDNTDFDDINAEAYPGATEICDDAVDNDGDGLTDCNDPDCNGDAGCITLYADNDGDGYGDPNNIDNNLGVIDNTDCDDNDPSVYPGATEILTDGVDNNCDGYIDQIPCSVDSDCPPGMTCITGFCQ